MSLPLRCGSSTILQLGFLLLSALFAVAQPLPVSYDLVYVRAPRYGDLSRTKMPEIFDPIHVEVGTDLMLLRRDGTEEVLVPGGNGAVTDPYLSFDAQWVYFAYFPDVRSSVLNGQRRNAPRAGSDIYKIHLQTRQIVRLTFQEWTPNTGIAPWSSNHLQGEEGQYYLGYGIFNLGPCPLPGGKIMFSSSRNGFQPNKDFTFPNLQLFVMDEDGSNVELIGHLNLGSALHPTILTDGRVMFSSYEGQGLRDIRVWGIWGIWPDGRFWEPVMSGFTNGTAFHFQTQLSNGDLAFVEYYNLNNNGFGTLLARPPSNPVGLPAFGSSNPRDDSNPPIQRGIWFFNPGHPSHLQPRYTSYSFSPHGLYTLTGFAHGEDEASSRNTLGSYAGKVTHPSSAPHNDVLITWTPGPANNLNRPETTPVYDAGLYVIPRGIPISTQFELVTIKNDPRFNEMQPRPVATYRAIYGVSKPRELSWLPNDGTVSPQLPVGTPFGLVGTASFYKRDTAPGYGSDRFNGLDPFNTAENGASSNWSNQGSDAGRYGDADIWAVRILAMEPTSHTSYGPGMGGPRTRGFYNHAEERLRILGEIPLRKFGSGGTPVLDVDGNPDTSFLAKLPADTPFTFQTLDRNGLALNTSQTWHQLRPGEARTNCGGCHAHSQLPTDFSKTAAAKPGFSIPNLATTTPLLSKNAQGEPTVVTLQQRAVDVEFHRDIWPILQRSCAGCHSKNGNPAAGLVLDDIDTVDGFNNTYNRLARDQAATYGVPPIISSRTWRQTNASRYVRMFQSRRSLLTWKVFGQRLDGWTNQDHPTESVPGNPSTLPAGANPNDADLDFTGTIMPPPNSGYQPLSADEKMLIARWIDLGCPIESQNDTLKKIGWFADDLRPTLTISSPKAGMNRTAIEHLRFGAFDYYSGLEAAQTSVVADFAINDIPAGTELAGQFKQTGDHIWSLALTRSISQLERGEITITVRDARGNKTVLKRTFSVNTEPGLSAPKNLRITASGY